MRALAIVAIIYLEYYGISLYISATNANIPLLILGFIGFTYFFAKAFLIALPISNIKNCLESYQSRVSNIEERLNILNTESQNYKEKLSQYDDDEEIDKELLFEVNEIEQKTKMLNLDLIELEKEITPSKKVKRFMKWMFELKWNVQCS